MLNYDNLKSPASTASDSRRGSSLPEAYLLKNNNHPFQLEESTVEKFPTNPVFQNVRFSKSFGSDKISEFNTTNLLVDVFNSLLPYYISS